ncbi:unnamed protein product, partial [Polarella glacialis]
CSSLPAIPGALGRRKRPRPAKDVHITWNEENIAEHDKERGTRQKIDEPPTPFVRSPLSVSEDEGERTPIASPGGGSEAISAVRPAALAVGIDPLLLGARLLELAAEEAEEPAPVAPATPTDGHRDSGCASTGEDPK